MPGIHQSFAVSPQVPDYIADFMGREPGIHGHV
jgi:hypothetical protein